MDKIKNKYELNKIEVIIQNKNIIKLKRRSKMKSVDLLKRGSSLIALFVFSQGFVLCNGGIVSMSYLFKFIIGSEI